MIILEAAPLPVQVAPLIASASQVRRTGSAALRGTIGICHIVPNSPGHETESAENVIEPAGSAENYFRAREHRELSGQAKIEIVRGPKHGVLQDEGQGAYRYLPNAGYYGHDQAAMTVEMAGARLKMVYFFQSIEGEAIGNTTYSDLCGKRVLGWRIR